MNFLSAQSLRKPYARCSKWCDKGITNSGSCEIDTLTSSARYTQIIKKPTYIVNNSSSCIDLIFCNNLNLLSNYCNDLSLFENVIIISFLVKSTFDFPFPQAMFVNCGIIVALMLKIYKKLFEILIGKRISEIFLLTEK